MLEVALTGGLASGKSTVGRMLEALGGYVIEADALGHQVLEGEARQAVLAQFGDVTEASGRIDRRKLGAIVFRDPARLAALNAIVHPAVDRLRRAKSAAIAAAHPDAVVFYEAAIHIETGTYKNFSKLVLVYCTKELQIQRAMERSGWTRGEVLERLSRQMPLEKKREYADYIIDTSGTAEETKRRAVEVYNQLKRL